MSKNQTKESAPAKIGADENSGYTITVIREGDKETFPKRGSSVKFHYVLRVNDEVVDSSRSRNQPEIARIGAGQLLPGLELAFPKLSLKSLTNVVVLPEKAHSGRGYPPVIPAFATMHFEIEIIAIE